MDVRFNKIWRWPSKGTLECLKISWRRTRTHPSRFKRFRLNQVFPNRRAFPWRAQPHPLLQTSNQTGLRSTTHSVTIHTALRSCLMDLPSTALEILLASAVRWVQAKPRQRQQVINDIHFHGVKFAQLDMLSTFECLALSISRQEGNR